MTSKKKSTKPKKPKDGVVLPICVALLLCEKVLIGEDGTASIIRIVDTIHMPEAANKAAIGAQVEIGGVSLFIALKQVNKETPSLDVAVTDPEGKKAIIGRLIPTEENNAQGGANSISQFRLIWAGPGLYWVSLETEHEVVILKSPIQINVAEMAEKNLNS